MVIESNIVSYSPITYISLCAYVYLERGAESVRQDSLPDLNNIDKKKNFLQKKTKKKKKTPSSEPILYA